MDFPTLVTALLVLFPAWLLGKRALRSWAMRTFTAVPDLQRAGTPRKYGRVAGTAVVCGGSIGGLFAARLCADHFERVVVVEPESWTFTPEARAPPVDNIAEVVKDDATYKTIKHKRTRVYQYTSIHGYQTLLLDTLRQLFSDFEDVAQSFGAFIAPADPYALLNGKHLWPTAWAQYGDAGLPNTIQCSRRTLEPMLRKLVSTSRPEIEYVQGTVTDYVLGDGGSIRAVVLRDADGASQKVECALAVDCTGVAQIGFKLLSRALPNILPSDIREQYNPQMNYSTFDFPAIPGFNDALRAMNIPRPDGGKYLDVEKLSAFFIYQPDPTVEHRSLVFMRRENGGVMILAGGWASEMPVTVDELRDFVSKLKNLDRVPKHVFPLLDIFKEYEHTATVSESRINSCSRLHYARAAKVLPRNFVALGDSHMRMNPRFGEGTTKAALSALTLDGVLRDLSPQDPSFGATFFKRLDSRTGQVWDGVKYADYGHVATTPASGESLTDGKFARWFNGKLYAAVETSPATSSALWHVGQFIAPPLDLFAPAVLRAILRETVWPSS
ncbi:hypothetical protein EXIGLDRAFT_141093 [Exidia glandulosa HHB12029]|uniref:FAD/NAD(P)-binding domain-containing protein n=1 Tax=Exidia glandulosa HHB12029 TaxID=1314781 RepID=A0A165FUS6_EXIGL|nr:hypothetical protein EXIGLDRAFT_141093 [Exidia glandulosa HHB12029]